MHHLKQYLRITRFVGLCFCLFGPSLNVGAQSVELSVDGSLTGADLRAPLDQVPVLIRLHPGNFDDFESLDANQGHLRIVSGQGEELPVELEAYNPELRHLWAWVLVPRVGTEFKAARLSLETESLDKAEVLRNKTVFQDPYKVVLHFSGTEVLSNATGIPLAEAIDGCRPESAGWIGSGLSLDTDCTISIHEGFSGSASWTLTFWMRLGGASQETILTLMEGQDRLEVIQRNGAYRIQITQSEHVAELSASFPVQPETWHQIGLVGSPGGIRFYVDGENVAQGSQNFAIQYPVLVLGNSHSDLPVDATIDELTISSVGRSDDWIRFGYRSQSPDFAVLAVEESRGEARELHDSTLALVLRSVTTDGWMIIGCIFILFAVALHGSLLKIQQVLYWRRQIGSFQRTYEAFIQEGKRRHLLLDAAFKGEMPIQFEPFRGSPLCQILEIIQQGLFEHSRQYGLQSLRPFELESLRVRIANERIWLGQMLGKRMVILTIAISGAPFVGLLGTVVGVMITFASIARNGEVDINAIAPGMSGALLATVAGLLVAIPSLFAYNLLLTEIKTISVSIRTFSDLHLALILESLEYRIHEESSHVE